MSRWQSLETWLYVNNKQDNNFTQAEYAESEGLTGPEASSHIQSYLQAQRIRASNRHTLRPNYVLRRSSGTRTSSAVWHVGKRTRDARHVGKAVSNDLRCRIRRAFIPDLIRIAQVNPRAARHVDQQVGPILEHALAIVEQTLEGVLPPELDESE